MAMIKDLYKAGEHYDTETGETWCDEVPTVAECDWCGREITADAGMMVFVRPGDLGLVHLCDGCAHYREGVLTGEFLTWLLDELGIWTDFDDAEDAEKRAVGQSTEVRRQRRRDFRLEAASKAREVRKA